VSHPKQGAATGRVLVATSTFFCLVDGVEYLIHEGDTIREGHPVQVAHPGAFVPPSVELEVGQ
jgi:hypothetical protein